MTMRTVQVTPAQAALLQDRVTAAQAATTRATETFQLLVLGHVALPATLEAIDVATGLLTVHDPSAEAPADG